MIHVSALVFFEPEELPRLLFEALEGTVFMWRENVAVARVNGMIRIIVYKTKKGVKHGSHSG